MSPVTLVSRLKKWGKSPITAALLGTGYYRWRRSRLPRDRALVLVYHHVTGAAEPATRWWSPFQRGVARHRFERQMRFLRRAMTPMPLDELVSALRAGRPLPPRAVAVTFDDGYLDNFTVAYPIMRRYAIPATIFVSTGYIETGRTFWWDEVYSAVRRTPLERVDAPRVARVPGLAGAVNGGWALGDEVQRTAAADGIIGAFRLLRDGVRPAALRALRLALGVTAEGPAGYPPMMTWAQLAEMTRHEMAIESHTHNHPMLGLADAGTVEDELTTSRRLIEKHVDRPVTGIAYPDGREGTYTAETLAAARALRFRYGCIADPGWVGSAVDPYALPRLPVGDVPLSVFVENVCRAWTMAGNGVAVH